MKKSKDSESEMRDDYDFSNAARGKYAGRFAEGANVVVVDPDVTDVFPDARSVNDALRALAKIVRDQRRERAS